MNLHRLTPENILLADTTPIPQAILDRSAEIVQQVQTGGEAALRSFTASLDGLGDDEPLSYSREALLELLSEAPVSDRQRLERIAARIRRFAQAQRASIRPLTVAIPGGVAGHDIAPVESAGCYAPGGRYPLPSSVLMTVIPARVAGVESVWVASPSPAPITLWAAAVAGADGVLAAGGAHAIAALALGVGPPPASDMVVGPGNLWVTAAKQALAGRVGIDLPAGPSELVVIGDSTSNADCIAADLLAQAEHDPSARPFLLTSDEGLIDAVDVALERQLSDLTTKEIAAAALATGGAVLCRDEDELVTVADTIAPEHLQLSLAEPDRFRARLRHFGAVFVGETTAEVFGDYGAGPNHVLPTGGAARFSGGLSVLTFLRIRSWMRGSPQGFDRPMIEDTIWLARQEGLEAHARAAELRLK